MTFLTAFWWAFPILGLAYLAYCLRKKQGRVILHPLFFLGTQDKLLLNRVTWKKPPLFPLFLLLSLSLFMFLGFSPISVLNETTTTSNDEVWVYIDHVLGSQLALDRESHEKIIHDFDQWIQQLSFHQVFLIDEKWDKDPSKTHYILENYSIQSLTRHLDKPIVPWSSALSLSLLSKLFEERGAYETHRPKLVIIGPRVHMQTDLQKIRGLFDEVILYPTTPFESLIGDHEEIIPSVLWNQWTKKQVQGDCIIYHPASGEIPDTARPGWFREVFSPRLKIISGFFRPQTGLILSFCDVKGSESPFFLNPLSEIIDLSDFFRYPRRFLECEDLSSYEQSDEWINDVFEQPTSLEDPWAFRRPSLWIADFDPARYHIMEQENRVWFPKNFRFDVDRLILLPFHQEFSGEPEMLAFPETQQEFRTFLAPEPPVQTLSFGPLQGIFESVLKIQNLERHSEDSVFFKLQDRVFLSRLPASLGKRELSRSIEWVHFWKDVFHLFHHTNPLGFQRFEWLSLDEFLHDPKVDWSTVSERLDPDTLDFVSWQLEDAGLQPGLYRTHQKEFILVEISSDARNPWVSAGQTVESKEDTFIQTEATLSMTLQKPYRPIWQFVVLIFMLMNLILIWTYDVWKKRIFRSFMIGILGISPFALYAGPFSHWLPFFQHSRFSYGQVTGIPIQACYGDEQTDIQSIWTQIRKIVHNYTAITLEEKVHVCDEKPVHIMILGSDWQAAPFERIQKHVLSGGFLVIEESPLSTPAHFRPLVEKFKTFNFQPVVYGSSSFANSFFRLQPFREKAYELYRGKDPFFPVVLFLNGPIFFKKDTWSFEQESLLVNIFMVMTTTNYKTEQLGGDLAKLSRLEKRRMYE